MEICTEVLSTLGQVISVGFYFGHLEVGLRPKPACRFTSRLFKSKPGFPVGDFHRFAIGPSSGSIGQELNPASRFELNESCHGRFNVLSDRQDTVIL